MRRVEIQNKKIVQARGKYNNELSRDDVNIINSWFMSLS